MSLKCYFCIWKIMFQIKTFESRALAATENLKRMSKTDAYKMPIAFKTCPKLSWHMFLVWADYLMICATSWRSTIIKRDGKLEDIVEIYQQVDKAKPASETCISFFKSK